ncbi:hypothetical protein [Deinococcus sp. AJ005]|uniref:hypothetical protein n=1 Tax=Deinococcus sp. AJ005 TaxID=2652443 RepID=UPI00125CC4BD|nr:hypothetical protein [Deinococcus sp. AJ005]QFP78604.1 hypothetical protein DAAJ005_18710 [Deinococcus sp. AJ005]
MKKFLVPPVLLGLAVLLASCGGGGDSTPSLSSKYALTVNVTGVASAPVKVINTGNKAIVFNGPLAGSKSFGDLAAGSVLSVQGGAVNGSPTPAIQNVTLDADKSVTLEYKPQTTAAPITANLIQGTVQGFGFGAEAVYLTNADELNKDNAGQISGAGQLTLSLSKVPSAYGRFPIIPPGNSNCTFQGTATYNPQISVFTRLLAFSGQDDLLGEITEVIVSGSSLKDSVVARLYSENAATVKGAVNCPDSAFGLNYDLHLKQGWNAVEYQKAGNTNTLRDLGPQVLAELRGVPALPSVYIELQDSNLNFIDDKEIGVDTVFFQDGGYSGSVALSTNVPGLTVEPKTLVFNPLPKLNAQGSRGGYGVVNALGLKSQALKKKLIFKYTGNQNLSVPFDLLLKEADGKLVGQKSGNLGVNRPDINLRVQATELELAPSSTQTIYAELYSVSNFNNNVQLSVSGLPTGAMATPVNVNLNGYGSAQIILTSDASLKAGIYPINVVATGGGKTVTAAINLTVPTPSVRINVRNPSRSLAQGERGIIEVAVESKDGFTGATTLRATGLPAGVTVAPISLQVVRGTTTTVGMPVIVSANATVGTVQFQITSADLRPNESNSNTFYLAVRPARIPLNLPDASSLVADHKGIWVISSFYDQQQLRNVGRFTHLVDNKIVAAVNLNDDPSFSRLVKDGTLLVSHSLTGGAYIVTDQGVQSIKGVPAEYNFVTYNAAADDKGRIWFVSPMATATGGMAYILACWNPLTSLVKSIPYESDLNGSIYPVASNDGKHIVFRSSYSKDILSVDTTTDKTSNLEGVSPSEASSLALRNDGLIYFTQAGQLSRINADGTTTTFQNKDSITELIGFDRKNINILWAITQSGINKIDITTNQASMIEMDAVKSGVLLFDGGIGTLTSENFNGTGVINSFLTILR